MTYEEFLTVVWFNASGCVLNWSLFDDIGIGVKGGKGKVKLKSDKVVICFVLKCNVVGGMTDFNWVVLFE